MEGVSRVAVESKSAAEGTVTLSVVTASDVDLRDEIFFAMAERRYAVISMELAEQSLEEIFLSLTGKKSKGVKGK
jgi:ABC-2 type transport system ATP-binding protein